MNGITTFGLILFFVISFFIVYEISKDKEEEQMLNIKRVRKMRSDLPMFMIKKRGCYGHCPIYNAAFYDDGVVGYFGEENVNRIGYYEFKLTDDQLKNVKDLMDKIDVPNLEDVYGSDITAERLTIVTFYCKDGFIKRVDLRHHLPNELANFLNITKDLVTKKTEI